MEDIDAEQKIDTKLETFLFLVLISYRSVQVLQCLGQPGKLSTSEKSLDSVLHTSSTGESTSFLVSGFL